jgi:hypothetical protein
VAATIKFDQSGLPAGTNNRSRSDIVAGTAVTITNVSPGSSNACALLAKPTDDDTAAISGSSPTWSITPKTGTFGTYRIRLIVDGESVIHTFTVKSPKRSLVIGAHNERANPNANLTDSDPGTWVNDSETNEGGHFKGWWKEYESLAKAIEASEALILTWKVSQVAHGLAVGHVVYVNASGVYTKAGATTLGALGRLVVSYVYDADNFRVCQRGYMNWPSHGLSIGTTYYLSSAVAGGLTSTPPATWEQPILQAITANDVLVFGGDQYKPARVTSDAGITADENNYAPASDTEWKECVYVRLTSDAEGWAITGWKAPTQGYPLLKEIHNCSAAYNLILKHNDAGSDAANRMNIEGGVDAVLPPRGSVFLWYDFTSVGWRVIHSRLRPIVISPTALAAQTDNWNPTDIAFADTVRVTLTGNQTLTGIVPAGDRRLILENVDTTDTLTLEHESASSTAANRFYLPNAENLAVPPLSSAILEYDGTSLRWRVTGMSAMGSSQAAFGGLYMQDNATTTSADTTWKVPGGTSTLKLANNFDMPANNRLRYTGAVTKKFRVMLTCTVNAPDARIAWLSLGKDGTRISTLKEENYQDAGRESNMSVTELVELAQNSYIEPMIRLASSTSTITIENLNLTISEMQAVGRGAASASSVNGFRLTPTTGAPIPTADVASAGTVYLTPWLHNEINLYSGGAWKIFKTAEVLLAVTGRTTDLPFDVFAYDNGGVVTLEFLDWTNATTRATALTRQDGRLVKSGDATRLYLGTIRARSATTYSWVTAADGASAAVKLDLWNYYNRVPIKCFLYDSTDNHTYTTAVTRQWRATSTYQIDIVNGVQEEYFEGITSFYSYNVSNQARFGGLGYDTTSAFTTAPDQIMLNIYDIYSVHIDVLKNQPGIGRHFYSWNQYAVAVGTTYWYGDNGSPTAHQGGVVGTWRA